MKTVTFRNRNGLPVTFEPNEDGLMKVSCDESHYWRFGTNDKYEVSFADPEGGPFIAVGDNLKKHHHPDLPDKLVAKIESLDSGVYLTLEDDRSKDAEWAATYQQVG